MRQTRGQDSSPPAPLPNALAVLTERGDTTRQRFTIGDLAREFGVSLRALRFYEDKGLLQPLREGQNRFYSRRDRARLKLIVMAKAVGFALKDIKEMLDYYDLGDGQLTQLRVAQQRCESQIAHLQKRSTELDLAITELQRAHAVISALLTQREGSAGQAAS